MGRSGYWIEVVSWYGNSNGEGGEYVTPEKFEFRSCQRCREWINMLLVVMMIVKGVMFIVLKTKNDRMLGEGVGVGWG